MILLSADRKNGGFDICDGNRAIIDLVLTDRERVSQEELA